MDTLTNLLKLSSMLLAALFGVIGLVTEHKNDEKKLTKWGKVAIAGIILSTLLTLGLHYRETSQAKASAIRAEQDATKREREAKAFADSLGHLQEEARAGIVKQEEALERLGQVKEDSEAALRGQQENLRQTARVGEGLEDSLEQQGTLLRGQRESAAAQLQQLRLQETVLGESRRLYLAQYKLSGLEISWELPPPVLARIREIINERDPKTGRPRFADAVYLSTAVTAGGSPRENFVGVKLDRNREPALVLSLRRPQGFFTRHYGETSPEWHAFARIFRLARPDFFHFKIEPGTELAEMDADAYSPPIILSGGRAYYTISAPDVKLSQLQDVVFNFQALASDNPDALPRRVRVRLLDEKIDFDREIELSWRECTTKKIVTVDSADGIVYGEGVCAKTEPASADFDKLLGPLRLAKAGQ